MYDCAAAAVRRSTLSLEPHRHSPSLMRSLERVGSRLICLLSLVVDV
jgi:hypothetical protein